MTCNCCNCCFCCCPTNCEPVPKKPKVEPPTRVQPTIPTLPTIDEIIETVGIGKEPTLDDIIETIENERKDEVTSNDKYEEEQNETSLPNKPPPVIPPPIVVPYVPFTQMTPEYTAGHPDYSTADRMRFSSTISTQQPNHGPDPTWADWTDFTWDKIPIDTTGMTRQQLCSTLFKNGYLMRGLRERYYEILPFADDTNPTVAEIDNWNIEVLRHFRRLIGSTEPVDPDPRLYLTATWNDERKYATIWDAYPGTLDSAYGPCAGGTNAHCGATFVPSAEDQAPYLAQYDPPIAPFTHLGGGSESIGAVNTNVPWAFKLTQRMSSFICAEGKGGHAGPFFGGRTTVGMSWFTGGGPGAPGGTILRLKWR